jgi:hypothetical protein
MQWSHSMLRLIYMLITTNYSLDVGWL